MTLQTDTSARYRGPARLSRLFATALFAAAGCSSSPVEWRTVEYPGRPPLGAPAAKVAVVPADACPESFRAAMPPGPDSGVVYAAWWRVRSDSSAELMAGRSADGGHTWSRVVPADTLDRSRRGCARPAPAVAADATGYVYFTYFTEPLEGPGVFFVHSMDGARLGTGDGIFHSPVAIVYGTRPAHVAIAAQNGRVVVAYEDPNAERPRVDVALSRSMGHIFEARASVSPSDLPATAPGAAIAGDTVTVWWTERTPAATGGGRVALRKGVWR